MEICKPENCTGCKMCADICPVNAISFEIDKKGFLYPKVDENCINCELCELKCPANNSSVKSEYDQKCYAAWNKDKRERINSSSGGVFSLLAKEILKDGGIVVGAAWQSRDKVKHIVVRDEKELDKLKKSKYLQSNTDGIYDIVQKELIKGKKVLFSGTPCQVAGIRNIVSEKNRENLITVDLICHGIPNEKIFHEHIIYLEKKFKKEIKEVNFRYKEIGWTEFKVLVTFEDDSIVLISTNDDEYFKAFNKNYILRNSCYQCKYSNLNREADITLGDFWEFYPLSFKMRYFHEGISCVLVNSHVGENLFSRIKQKIIFEERTLSSAKESNHSLIKSFDKNKNYELFWNAYIKEGYEKAITILSLEGNKVNVKVPTKIKIKAYVKKHLYYFPKWMQKLLVR